MEKTCGNLTANLDCGEDDNSMVFTPDNSQNDTEGTILLNLPEGAEILDSGGNVIYTQDGGPDKTKIRMPPPGA